MNTISKFKYRFYFIKRQRKNKIRVKVNTIAKCLDFAQFKKAISFSRAKRNEKMSHV